MLGVFWRFSRAQWIAFSVTSFIYFVAATVASLQGPLYPQMAYSKNVTATTYGTVFGLYGLVQLVVPPFISILAPVLGLKTTLNTAVVLAGTSTVAFGFLDRIQDTTAFICMSYFLRAVEAIGAAGVYVCAFTIVGMEFPGHIVQVVATLETFLGIGQALGPFVGSVLSELGGSGFQFILPFAVIGFLHFVSGFLANVFVLNKEFGPKVVPVDPDHAPADFRFIELLEIPAVLLFAFSVSVSGINNGLLYALLDPFMSQASQITDGSMFLILTGAYTVSAVFVGHVGSKMAQPAYLSVIGSLSLGLAIWTLGPAPFLPFTPTIVRSAVIFVVIGVSQSLVQITGYLMTLEESKVLGFSEEILTPHVSALFLSSYSMGFVGPILGGYLYDKLGFSYTCLILGTLDLFLAIWVMSFIGLRSWKNRRWNRLTIDGEASEKYPLVRQIGQRA